MCRNIKVLHHFEPPSTPAEIEAAATTESIGVLQR